MPRERWSINLRRFQEPNPDSMCYRLKDAKLEEWKARHPFSHPDAKVYSEGVAEGALRHWYRPGHSD